MITRKKENCFSWVSKQNREPIIGENSLLRSRFHSYKLLQADRDAIREKKVILLIFKINSHLQVTVNQPSTDN